jgi:hypothetical protein
MKKSILLAVAVAMLTGCGFMKNGASAPATTTTTTSTTTNSALTSGQGAGTALQALYAQYKADGKYDYTNMQNAMNTISLLSSCQGLKENYKNTTYLKDFGKGMIASSLGLVNQNNVQTVTNSLVDMVKNNENVQAATTQTQNAANTTAGYLNTASQYAGSISNLLSLFGNK